MQPERLPAIAAARRLAPLAALTLAAVFVVGHLIQAQRSGFLAFDFKLDSARRLLDGQTLYPTTGPGTGDYPYPPLWAMLVTPLLVVPTVAAQYLAGILCALAVGAALWVVGLRDPYCYAIAFCTGPVILVVTVGNPTAFVTLLVALAYRYGSAPVGVATALKLYPWPMLLWGLVTRGRRDLAIGMLTAAAVIVVPWALLGFDGLGRYLEVGRDITAKAREDSGVLPIGAQALLTAVALTGMWLRRDRPADSFAFASLAMLTASPVLWGFYLVAALVPLAIQRPRLSLAWLSLLGLWWLDYYGRLVAMLALLAWCGIGAPAFRVPRAWPARST